MNRYPPSPALTAVVRPGNTAGQWQPVNYVAHALAAIAGSANLTDNTREQARKMGIVFHVQRQQGSRP